ncbi:MAG: c-type cytochrome [Vicinamibacteria bacterium]
MAHRGRLVVFLAIAGLLTAGAAAAQTGVKRVSAPRVRGVDGAVLYQAYCAACHGPAAQGDGPASRRLSAAVPDLTRIAARDGAYDSCHVLAHLQAKTAPPDTMANFHVIILGNYAGDHSAAQLAESNLARYVESLQSR